MKTLLSFICCLGFPVILAGAVTAFNDWWDSREVHEVNEPPRYITRTYQDIKRSQND